METDGHTPPTGGGNQQFDPQYLEGGKILTGKNFPKFVETWNWLVDFCRNLRGDGDAAPFDGQVSVDKASIKHPIIRLTKTIPTDGGGGGEATPTWNYGRFRITELDTSKIQLSNCKIFATGAVYGNSSAQTVTIDSTEKEVYIWAVLDVYKSTVTVKGGDYNTYTSELVGDDYKTTAFLLYVIYNGTVREDNRIGPYASAYI